ncbi:glycogen synthase, partial [Candidatus Falkowbacteria bacterium CG10_big_fil_rev_8_21_14_0_10_43_10]
KNVSADKWELKRVKKFKIAYDKKIEPVEILRTLLPESRVPVYFLSNHKYFNKEEVYSGGLKKFLFYSLASLEAMKVLRFKPDIIHCHDHQTGLAKNIIASTYKEDKFFQGVKIIFIIHNLNYQGKQNPVILEKVDHDIDKLAPVVNDLKDGDINFMVQGILSADIITTVSPAYAEEILKPELGVGLDNILRKRKKDLYGIINGLDVDLFNPATDRNLKFNYSVEPDGQQESKKTILELIKGKQKNKIWLQKKVGLPVDGSKALAGFVSRIVWQKGADLITEEIVKKSDCQFVVLGAGEEQYHRHFKNLAEKHPEKFSAQIKFSIEMASQIYAASDIFLMPSRYEPCGLGQMIAMRYGSVPIVRATGGLKDTVFNLSGVKCQMSNVGGANGFVFKKFKSKELEIVLKRALDIYYNKPKKWQKLQLNGMKTDFSWDKSAKEYVKLYKKLVKN